MSPVLHVEGLGTLLGAVVVGRRLSVDPFVVIVAFDRVYTYVVVSVTQLLLLSVRCSIFFSLLLS